MMDGMRLSVSMTFRGRPAEVRSALPADLGFLGPHVRRVRGTTRARLEIPPEQADRIVRWAGTSTPEGTLGSAIRFDERFEASDLDGQQVTELTRPLDGEMPEVVNAPDAYLGRWTCSHCDRVKLDQRRPLAVVWTEPPRDLELTASGELLARSELEPILAASGVQTRGLKGTDGVKQVVVPRGVDLDLTSFPLSIGRKCPGCGRATIERTSDAVGSFEESHGSGLWVSREFSLSLRRRILGGAAIAASAEPIDWNGLVTDESRHTPGAEFDLNTETAWTSQGSAVILAGAALLRHLLAQGARTISFRPVRVPHPSA